MKNKRSYIMASAYKMITLQSYIKSLNNKNYVSLADKTIEQKVEEYMLSQKRAESHVKVLEAMVG